MHDVFGPVSAGSLVVRCSPCGVNLSLRQEKSTNWIRGMFQVSHINVSYEAQLSLDRILWKSTQAPCTLSFYFMPVHSGTWSDRKPVANVIGMLLAPTGAKGGQYHREGPLTIYVVMGDWNEILRRTTGNNQLEEACYLESPGHEPHLIEIV